jgi:hypothetical protein
MNKEQIEARLKQLQVDQEQAKATFLACAGAIEDCQHWLKQLDTKEEKKSK